MQQTEIEKIAERRGAKFLPRSASNVDADFYTAIPGKPRSQWKRVGMTAMGADLKPGKFDPCPKGLCSGNGLLLTHDNGRGHKSYAACPCKRKS